MMQFYRQGLHRVLLNMSDMAHMPQKRLNSLNTLCTEVEKKYFFMFSKTSLKTNFWNVHKFFGFSKKIIAKSSSVLILCSFKYCFSQRN